MPLRWAGGMLPAMDTLASKAQRLDTLLAELAPVLVAFSGGVDSSLLYARARRVLGARALGVIGVSPSLGGAELAIARRVAAEIDAPLVELPTSELERPAYRANAGDRCYHCKSELFDRVVAAARFPGWTVCDGTHAGDATQDRAGWRAGQERGVRSPLREVGLDKADVRALARADGLSVWDRPARPCLASRVAVGHEVTRSVLADIEAFESVLAAARFRVYRARVAGDRVTIELGQEELTRADESHWRAELADLARARGYRDVLVDPDGYRGSP